MWRNYYLSPGKLSYLAVDVMTRTHKNLWSLPSRLIRQCIKEISTLHSKTFTKSVLLLLIWNSVVRILYDIYLLPPALHDELSTRGTLGVTAILSVINIFSPVAGYLGDVKYSRFGFLKCGSYLMIAATSVCVLSYAIIVAFAVRASNTPIQLFMPFFLLTFTLYLLGYLLFSANFIQFSTDQLRDAPTKCSVIFLYAMLWSNNVSKTLGAINHIDRGNKSFSINSEYHITATFPDICVSLVLAGLTFLSSLIIIIVVLWKRKWFLTEKIKGNPYKTVVKVLMFALRHKSPIRRSAFTFCENEPPSRIDFSKRRYGGPYSTEQVEDVKVLLNIVKVLVSLGPVFLLDYAANLSSINYHHIISNNLAKHFNPFLLSPGVLSSVIVTFTLPFYLFLLKPMFERCAYTILPNFFKRMSLSFVLLTVFFITYFLCDGFAFAFRHSVFEHCPKNRSSILNWSYVHIPQIYLTILQATLLALSHILLNVSVWEFICCQSPQHMKGLLFGLSLAIRAFMEFLAVLVLALFVLCWRSTVVSCHIGYSFLNILIGTITVLLFGLTARKYKYRKRDDICNVYQFAEDYYSK